MAERLVVIGGDGAGMSAATNARRGRPDLEIVVLERGRDTSYAACGIPHVVAGEIDALDDLVVRTPQELRDQHRIDVRVGHEVRSIDLDHRRLEVRILEHGRTLHLGFDQLVVATGARPRRPSIPGIDAPWIRGVQNLEDTRRLLSSPAGAGDRVVIVGGGYIGLEMAESYIRRGSTVTVIERSDSILGKVDEPISQRAADALGAVGVRVRTGTEVIGFEDGTVQTSNGDLPADLAILGLGVEPEADLAAAAGLELGAGGAVSVDHRQRTSADGVWSAGDCADSFHLVSREKVHIALGTVANKTGRIAGINIGGGYASFPGVLGTAVTRVCDVEFGRTGLDERGARAAGIEFVVGEVESTSRADYFPGGAPLHARVLVERAGGRIIGAQIAGADRVGKRIDVAATAITAGLTADQMVDLDLGYAPAISTAWDPWQIAARRASSAL